MATWAAIMIVSVCTILQGFQYARLSDDELVNRLEHLESRLNVCEHEIHELKVIQNNTVHKRDAWNLNVAFSTLLAHDQGHIGIGQTIKCDRVLLNEGSGYSADTGIFTVPITGVYLFSYFCAHAVKVGQVWIELMKNGNKLNSGVADQYHNYQDIQGGNIAIIRAETGDEIWLEGYHQNDAILDGGMGWTTFSGVLLH